MINSEVNLFNLVSWYNELNLIMLFNFSFKVNWRTISINTQVLNLNLIFRKSVYYTVPRISMVWFLITKAIYKWTRINIYFKWSFCRYFYRVRSWVACNIRCIIENNLRSILAVRPKVNIDSLEAFRRSEWEEMIDIIITTLVNKFDSFQIRHLGEEWSNILKVFAFHFLYCELDYFFFYILW